MDINLTIGMKNIKLSDLIDYQIFWAYGSYVQ